MSLGLTERFNILRQSPHDLVPPAEQPSKEEGLMSWVPSRYNVRATTDDGRLVLWNSYLGTMSVFEADKKSAIEGLLSQKGFEAEPTGVVQYLFKRGFLVKRGTDEYRRIQLGFGQQHYRTDVLELILLASEDCNFRCQYCYEDFTRGTMQPTVRTGVKRLVDRRLGGLKRLAVHWFGGEPLYGMEAIEELAPFFLAVARERSLRYRTNMTTNGYLLTSDVADKLLSWQINSFQITLDGGPEDHNRSRPTREGHGTFEQIFANLESLHRRSDDFLVDLRVNFDRQNALHLTDLFDRLETDFSNDKRFRLRFRPVGKWGGPNDADLAVCGVDEAVALELELKSEARKKGLQLSDEICQVSGMGAHVCYAARPYNFIIGASGKVMKCTVDLDKQDRNVVGQLSEDGDIKLDFDKFALWTEPAFEGDPKCHKCVVLPVCQGVYCPLVRIESAVSPCSPLRMNAKKEMLQAVQHHGENSRRRIVDNNLPFAASEAGASL